jgi:hypothetical protein
MGIGVEKHCILGYEPEYSHSYPKMGILPRQFLEAQIGTRMI